MDPGDNIIPCHHETYSPLIRAQPRLCVQQAAAATAASTLTARSAPPGPAAAAALAPARWPGGSSRSQPSRKLRSLPWACGVNPCWEKAPRLSPCPWNTMPPGRWMRKPGFLADPGGGGPFPGPAALGSPEAREPHSIPQAWPSLHRKWDELYPVEAAHWTCGPQAPAGAGA